MDSTGNIKLFNTDQDKVVLPTISDNSEEESNLISDSIDNAILGEKVKTLIIPEDADIYPVNYVIDINNVKTLNRIQMQSVNSLKSIYGDVPLYLYNDSRGLVLFGMGDKYSLERMLPIVKTYVFEDEIKVYKNLTIDGKFTEVNGKDITKMRLNL